MKYISWWTIRVTPQISQILGQDIIDEIKGLGIPYYKRQLGIVLGDLKSRSRGDLAAKITHRIEQYNRDVFAEACNYKEYDEDDFVNIVGQSGVSYATWSAYVERLKD